MADHTWQTTHLAALAQNRLDMVRAFHLDRVRGLDRLAARVFERPARNITRLVFHYDHLVGTQGLAAASDWLVEQFAASLTVYGRVPDPGQPLIIASNHPGLIDAMCLFSQLSGHDLRVIVAERPVLRLLPHISQHLIYVHDDPERRLPTIRTAADHLRRGGTLLTFPGGHIEPDPALRPGAVAALEQWSDSLDLFARLVPDVQVLPAAVSGVISPRALRHPAARIYRTPERREWVAATLQVMLPRYRDSQVTLRLGTPIPAAPQVMSDVRTQMAHLLQAR
jgi:1-acyl-sn-glycerol-3-phosphate acyltransferase